MKNNNIPKKGNLYYEIIEDIPVIWYATNNLTYLERDIINLINILFMHKNKKNINELTSSLTECFNRIQNLKKIVEDSLKSLTSLKSNITEIKSSISYIYDDIFQILNT
jgi:peptidoglycan hydrolase CwlO-like protein